MTFNICYVGSKYPCFISYRVLYPNRSYHHCSFKVDFGIRMKAKSISALLIWETRSRQVGQSEKVMKLMSLYWIINRQVRDQKCTEKSEKVLCDIIQRDQQKAHYPEPALSYLDKKSNISIWARAGASTSLF